MDDFSKIEKQLNRVSLMLLIDRQSGHVPAGQYVCILRDILEQMQTIERNQRSLEETNHEQEKKYDVHPNS